MVPSLAVNVAVPPAGNDAAEVELVDVAVLVLVDPGNAGKQVVGQRKVDPGAQADPLAAAVSAFDVAFARAFGTLGEHLDRAAFGVAARQRALRAAQDLDPLEVEQVEHRAGQLRIVDVVDVDAHAGLVGAGLKSLAPMPRMATEIDGPNDAPCGLSVTLGALSATCAGLVWFLASIISAVTAVIASGVSCRFCCRNCAVTRISPVVVSLFARRCGRLFFLRDRGGGNGQGHEAGGQG